MPAPKANVKELQRTEAGAFAAVSATAAHLITYLAFWQEGIFQKLCK